MCTIKICLMANRFFNSFGLLGRQFWNIFQIEFQGYFGTSCFGTINYREMDWIWKLNWICSLFVHDLVSFLLFNLENSKYGNESNGMDLPDVYCGFTFAVHCFTWKWYIRDYVILCIFLFEKCCAIKNYPISICL